MTNYELSFVNLIIKKCSLLNVVFHLFWIEINIQ